MMVANEKTISHAVRHPILLCPWLVGLAALALYGLTLHHWVTFGSLPFASQITGWDWHPGPLPWRPNPQYPLFFILTYPLRLLPAGWRVVGWNVFTAVCAALTLAMLARSVRLLSHDRTKEQRLREGGEFALLSVRAAFLPAAFAVLLLAGQLTFWQNAVAGTGEMIDLLVFAFLILCLLEFRISQSERRLNLLAFVYGVGMANNWALIGFFPCFLLALIWIKRMGFFNWKFVLRMTGWGGLGLLLYGLLPLLGAIHHDGSFWELLHQKLTEQHLYLTRLPRYYAFIAGIATLLPLLFAAINWPSFEAELSAGAHNLTRVMFRVLHVVFLAVGVLMFFDVKSSPSPRNMGMGVVTGAPGFLSFYYLAALSVGYFSGYVLLVFGKELTFRWGRATGILRVINLVVTGLLWAAAIGLPALLFRENFPHMRDFTSPVVAQFGNEMAKALPSKPAIVLADDRFRLYLAMGASQKLGLPDQYTFVDSRALIHREYLRYLVERYPAFRKEHIDLDSLPEEVTGRQIGDLLEDLSQRQWVYYLHPSFGNYFERVCMTPHRLGGDVHPYPTNALATLGLTPAQIATNQAYWHKLEKESLAGLLELAKRGPDGLPKRSADAVRIANYYSQMLDYWGTELQKAGTELKLPLLLNDAGDQFAEAFRLNPLNYVARLNQQFNAHLRGLPPPPGLLISSPELADQVTSWEATYNLDGPADVPDLDIRIGTFFAGRGVYLQAAHLFQRCLELAPNDPEAELALAKTYIDMGLMDAGLALIRDSRQRAAGDPVEMARIEALAYAKKNDFAQADKLLTEARLKYPKDERFPGWMAEFYRRMGYSALLQDKDDPSKEKEAAKWFQKALAASSDQLQLLNTTMNVTAHAAEIPGINLQKAEMQMMLKDYPAAILTLNALVRQDPENPVPLLNRAISELQGGQIPAAKIDYLALEKMGLEVLRRWQIPEHMVYYGLAQVAQKQRDKPAEIHYDRLYLKFAPHNTLEFTNVTQQLHQLEAR
jgi:tetratricopeptide (TPR) repeat protein